jgi:hypothetical protein
MNRNPPALNDKPKPAKRIRRTRQQIAMANAVPKRGSLSNPEISIIEHAVIANGKHELVGAQIDGLALALNREPTTIAKHVQFAKERLQSRAGEYADLHIASANLAMQLGEVGEARKAAEWALERISAKDASGNDVRVIDSAAQSSNAPVIKIGIALGGLPAKRDDAE